MSSFSSPSVRLLASWIRQEARIRVAELRADFRTIRYCFAEEDSYS